jgi:hypothetical protein
MLKMSSSMSTRRLLTKSVYPSEDHWDILTSLRPAASARDVGSEARPPQPANWGSQGAVASNNSSVMATMDS